MRIMRSLSVIALTFLVGFSAQARQIGAEHNTILDCLRRLDPQNRMQVPPNIRIDGQQMPF